LTHNVSLYTVLHVTVKADICQERMGTWRFDYMQCQSISL